MQSFVLIDKGDIVISRVARLECKRTLPQENTAHSHDGTTNIYSSCPHAFREINESHLSVYDRNVLSRRLKAYSKSRAMKL